MADYSSLNTTSVIYGFFWRVYKGFPYRMGISDVESGTLTNTRGSVDRSDVTLVKHTVALLLRGYCTVAAVQTCEGVKQIDIIHSGILASSPA